MLNMVCFLVRDSGDTVADCGQDALTGIGHACGHNLIAVSSVAAAIATANVMMMRKLGGKVVLFGTPAEGEFNMIRC